MSRLKGADLGIVVTNPTLAALGGAKNTIGAGLPSFIGRLPGDGHYDSAAKVFYILTGAAGVSLLDTFNRTSLGTTLESGQTAISNANGAISNNRFVASVSSAVWGGDIGAGYSTAAVGGYVQADFFRGASGDTFELHLGSSDATGGSSGGWRFAITGTVMSLIDPTGSVNGFIQNPMNAGSHDVGTTHTWTLQVIGGVAKVYKDGALFGTSSTMTQGNGTKAAVWIASTGGGYADNFSAQSNGTLAWTAAAVIQSLASLGGAKNTVGTGLPAFGGRTPGDGHYDNAAKVLYTLTGVAGSGGNVTDTFTGPDVASVVGRVTETGGVTWAASTNGLTGAPGIVSNQLSFDSGANRGVYVSLGTAGTHDVSADVTLASAGRVAVRARMNGSDNGTGYQLEVDRGAGTIRLLRGTGAVLVAGLGTPAAGPDTYRITTFGTSTITVSVYRNGALLTTYVDASPGTVGNAVGASGIGGSAGQFSQVDNISAVDVGTLAWTPTTVANALNYRGAWTASPTPAYAVNDSVVRNGLAYTALAAPSSSDPAGPSSSTGGQNAATAGPTASGNAVASAFTVSAAEHVTAVTVYMTNNNAMGTGTVRVGITNTPLTSTTAFSAINWLGYVDVAASSLVTAAAPGAANQLTLTVPADLVAGTTYWLAIVTPAGTSTMVGNAATVSTASAANSGFIASTNVGGSVWNTAATGTAFNGGNGAFTLNFGLTASSPWTPLAPTVENVNVVAASGSAVTLPDVTTATMHRITLTAATPAITLPAPGAGKSFTVELVQDATGGRAPTWATPSGAIRWPGGAAPTITATANAIDVITFVCIGGTNWYGFVAGQAFA